MIRVALIDSGVGPDLEHRVAARRAFCGAATALRHGQALARVIADAAPHCGLIDARVFGDRLACTAETLAQAIDWAVDEQAAIINLSLGLRDDREVLKHSVRRALEAGVVVVASVPARGQRVYPAAYPGVLRVTGDARCAPGAFSWIGDAAADCGASAQPLPDWLEAGGSSIAAARVTGALAALAAAGEADPVAAFRTLCRFTGRERRT